MFMVSYTCPKGQIKGANKRDKQNKKTKEVKIMEIGMAIFFVVLAIGIWFFEGTKIGRKITDYAVQKIVEDFEDLGD